MKPHPDTPHYAGAEQKRRFLLELFDRASPHYDRISHLLAMGTDRWYRRFALLQAGLKPGMRVLDVASGTGLFARAADGILKSSRGVFALEPSAGMIAHRPAGRLRFVRGFAEALPFADASFDLVTLGYAVRHLPDLEHTFAEFRRVLRGRGRLLIVEVSRPKSRAAMTVLRGYFRFVFIATRLMTGSPAAELMMRYYWETIEACVPSTTITAALEHAGFTNVRRQTWGGVISEYHATASSPGASPVESTCVVTGHEESCSVSFGTRPR
jgi:demethylmenaquinone methyltransferase / 2-methoxy-6-polyprenyl-1,4-benzoquinol methylase